MEHELQERASDFIAASSVERLSELEGTVASQATQIRELEQRVADRDAEVTRTQAI